MLVDDYLCQGFATELLDSEPSSHFLVNASLVGGREHRFGADE